MKRLVLAILFLTIFPLLGTEREIITDKIIRVKSNLDNYGFGPCSLRNAIALVNHEGNYCNVEFNSNFIQYGYTIVIELSKNKNEIILYQNRNPYQYKYDNAVNDLNIDTDEIVYLFGNEVNIKANGFEEVFNAYTNSDVYLYDVNFIGSTGSTIIQGAIFYVRGDRSVTLENIQIKNNSIFSFGMVVSGVNINVNNSKIVNNQLGGAGVKTTIRESGEIRQAVIQNLIVQNNICWYAEFCYINGIELIVGDISAFYLINSLVSGNQGSGILSNYGESSNLNLYFNTIINNQNIGIEFEDESLVDLYLINNLISSNTQGNIYLNQSNLETDKNNFISSTNPQFTEKEIDSIFYYYPIQNAELHDKGICIEDDNFFVLNDLLWRPRPGTEGDVSKCDIGSLELQIED